MSSRSSLRRALGSDTAFYVGVGCFTILLFAIGLAVLALSRPDGVGTTELVGFVAGFGLFMVSYFVAMAVYRLVPE